MSYSDGTSSFSGCHLKGLPIGIPFKSKFTFQSDETSAKEDEKAANTFIILPLQLSEDFEAIVVNLESDGNPSEERQANLQQELADKLVFNNWNFIPAGKNCWKISVCKRSSSTCVEGSLTTKNTSATWPGNELIERNSEKINNIIAESGPSPCVKDERTRKRKHQEYSDEYWVPDNIPALKITRTVGHDTKSKSSRKSSRLKAARYRPDYKAIAEGNGEYYTDENFDDYNDTFVKMEKMSCEESNLENDRISEINNETNAEDALNKAIKLKTIQSEDDVINSSLKKQSKQKSSRRISRKCVQGTSSQNSEPTEKAEDSDTELEESSTSFSQGSVLRKNRRKTKTNKTKGEISRKTTKKSRTFKRTSSDSENTDDDEQGVTDEETKRETAKPTARELRKKELEEKKLNRINVKLEDHTDKYRVDVMESFARKDRGKAKEECKIEVLLCTVCEKFRSKSKDIMENHIECHVNGELHCEQCDFVAAFIGDLRKHKRLEHKKNVFICSECGAETSGKDGLKDHMGKVHGNPQWTCKHCLAEKGEKFNCISKTKFRQHLRTDHPDKMVACEACKGLFAHKYHLQKHLNTGCPGDGTKQYPCEICGKTYSSFQQVNNHITRVHNKVRKFQCKFCPFAAAGAPGLAQHLHTHTGYHPFKCDQCTFSCVQRFQLTSHMRTHTGEKPYKCLQCNYAAAWKIQLKDHLKVHGLPNSVCCEPCNIMFKDARGLKSHQSRDHSRDMFNKQ